MATHESVSDYEQYDATNPHVNLTDDPPSYEPPSDQLPTVALTSKDLPLKSPGGEVHRRLSIDEESDTSSADEKLSVVSITSSIEDQLT